MKTILFQGDSITDCGRDRNNLKSLGNGYPRLIEAELGFKAPAEYEFINKGVSGDRVPDLYARIVRDIINIKPDVMSILIGVNDVWRSIDDNCGTGLLRFKKVYDILLSEIKNELPDVKIMILEPFVLEGSATRDCEEYPDRYGVFRKSVEEMAQAAKALSEKYDVRFIPLQSEFDKAEKMAPSSYWLEDGVHPTAKGHRLIMEQWLKAFEEIEGEKR